MNPHSEMHHPLPGHGGVEPRTPPRPDPAAVAAPAAGKPVATARRALRFDDMQLLVGDRLQVECPAHLGGERLIVRMVGHVEHVSLLVTAPAHHGMRLDLLEGDALVVRAFSRQTAFAFRATILQVCKRPFDYLHLSFPEVVHSSTIRKSTRVRTHIAVQVAADPDQGRAADVAAAIHNISATGVLLMAHQALAPPGAVLRLSFVARLHEVDTPITVEAEVRSLVKDDEPGAVGAPTSFRHGLEFRGLRPADHVLITAFVYQQIIENPHCIV